MGIYFQSIPEAFVNREGTALARGRELGLRDPTGSAFPVQRVARLLGYEEERGSLPAPSDLPHGRARRHWEWLPSFLVDTAL